MLSDHINVRLKGKVAAAFRAFGARMVKDKGLPNKTPDIAIAAFKTLPEYKALDGIKDDESEAETL